MSQVREQCPHCGHEGADILRSERRPGVVVLYLICRACSGDWLSAEPIDPSAAPSQSDVKKHPRNR